MEPERSIKVFVSVKFRQADGNQPQLDEVEVAVTNGTTLLQLIQATVEKLKELLPPTNDRAVLSKFAAPLDKFTSFYGIRIVASELAKEKCEENGLYRVELLRPDENDQPFYTLPLRHADDVARPKRRHSTLHTQAHESGGAESSKKARHSGFQPTVSVSVWANMETEEAAEADNELHERDLSSLVTKIEGPETLCTSLQTSTRVVTNDSNPIATNPKTRAGFVEWDQPKPGVQITLGWTCPGATMHRLLDSLLADLRENGIIFLSASDGALQVNSVEHAQWYRARKEQFEEAIKSVVTAYKTKVISR